MDRDGFRAFLVDRDLADDQVDASLDIAEQFETYLREEVPGTRSENATADAVNGFSQRMIERGSNTWDHYVALIRYGRFLGNDVVYVAALELIDGAEALDTLHARLADEIGEAKRDAVFAGIDLPPLGMSNASKPKLLETVMSRLQASVDPDTCLRILGGGLRYLEDGWYLDAKTKYEEAGGIDPYLEQKAAAFIAELEQHRDKETLYFNQRINNDVIDYVRQHQEIASGVRQGTVLFEAKIPHQAIEYLNASDPGDKAYHYCHCPWVKESLRGGASPIPATFCHCSAAFHKKPYEVIFGRALRADVVQSILAGDLWCKFAIHLPEDVV